MERFEPAPACGAKRGPRARTRCELPPDHVVGRASDHPIHDPNHFGRDSAGRQHWWPPIPKTVTLILAHEDAAWLRFALGIYSAGRGRGIADQLDRALER